MKIRPLSFVRNTIVCALALVLLLGGCFLLGTMRSNRVESAPKVTSDLVSQRLLPISELATVKYIYTSMGRFEKSTDFYGWKVPFTEKMFLVSYNGEVKAGVDMKGVTIKVQKDQITIGLPAAEIFSNTIDENSIKVFDESKNIFNPISITDYARFSADEKYKNQQKAIDGGLLIEAKEKAKDAIISLLTLSKDNGQPYKIKFVDIP